MVALRMLWVPGERLDQDRVDADAEGVKCPICWIVESVRAFRGRAWTRAHRRRSPLCPYRNSPIRGDAHTRELCKHEEATGCMAYGHARTAILLGVKCSVFMEVRTRLQDFGWTSLTEPERVLMRNAKCQGADRDPAEVAR